jgi:hypothetical protein
MIETDDSVSAFVAAVGTNRMQLTATTATRQNVLKVLVVILIALPFIFVNSLYHISYSPTTLRIYSTCPYSFNGPVFRGKGTACAICSPFRFIQFR